jgi:hypothetical protein
MAQYQTKPGLTSIILSIVGNMATGAADVFLPGIFQLIWATQNHRHLSLQALKVVSFDQQTITNKNRDEMIKILTSSIREIFVWAGMVMM